ncbi:hypothetical protein FOZ76_01820 [Verticiella sediminum]|uniref:Sel1 repeat family protein n=1 Tax=Verticiella sediminum TaxID=1247510 RepID=A0A556B194_9BURK|nr:hypothetical protein [Verticiella sediminum]TSH98515.1 hypothetical protein FOZ76_01820 [Verticiella sediminum]
MKRLRFVIFACLGLLAAPASSQDVKDMSNAQIVAAAPDLHPAALYVLASRLLAEGKGQEAANWMYAGQLRYRILLATGQIGGREGRPLFDALTEQVGRPVNEYIAGDVDEWIAAMNFALEWDAAEPNPRVDVSKHRATVDEVRGGLERLRDSLDGRRDEIAREREKNGLENR